MSFFRLVQGIYSTIFFSFMLDSVFIVIKSTGQGSIGEMVHDCEPKGAGSDYQASVSSGVVPGAKIVQFYRLEGYEVSV